ncbi:MAG TPA: DUF192 domain-containing protein [Alphaproteobacteria bacterium]
MTMKYIWILIMAAGLALTTVACAADTLADIAIVRADNTQIRFSVELALDADAQEQGLMYRTDLAENHGMLFIYKKAMPRYFWMKNTLIPLDIIFFGRKNEIIFIGNNAKPESLDIVGPKGQDVCTVLEIGGGEAKRLGLAIGDRLIAQLPDCK